MKIEKTTILIFVAVTFIFGLLTNANANLIVNGSFEVGPDPGASAPLPNGSTAIAGWTVTREGVDYKGTYWKASDLNRSLDLDNSPGFGGIKQTFPTTSGVLYSVTFDIAGNPYREFGDPVMKYMGVEAAGQSAVFSFDATGHDYLNMGWETRSWQFTAAIGISTTIEFYTLDSYAAGYSGYCGPVLDNVSVVEIPEPATMALLGLGALSLIRRKRSA